jgi:predicted house-cleaning noncanonical NTP pyrophosphatase (MazG superfamily)
MRVRYDKLIRDRIPEAMDRDGVRFEVGVLNGRAYRDALLAKVVEEAEELREAAAREDVVKELADVLEVLEALMQADGTDVEQVRAVQAARRRDRGGFERRLVLRWTES